MRLEPGHSVAWARLLLTTQIENEKNNMFPHCGCQCLTLTVCQALSSNRPDQLDPKLWDPNFVFYIQVMGTPGRMAPAFLDQAREF